jgi:hypothetical protein
VAGGLPFAWTRDAVETNIDPTKRLDIKEPILNPILFLLSLSLFPFRTFTLEKDKNQT